MAKKVLFLIITVLLSMPVFAQTPVPEKKELTLEQLDQNRQKAEKKKKELEQSLKSHQKELESLKNTLITQANKAKKSEKSLDQIENKIVDLKQKKKNLFQSIEKDRAVIADMLLILSRISMIPPETLIIKQGSAKESLHMAMALKSAIEPLSERTENLKNQLAELEKIETDLKNDQNTQMALLSEYQKEQNSISTMVERRQKIISETQENLEDQEKDLKVIASQASNLKDLIARIKKHNEKKKPGFKKDIAPPRLVERFFNAGSVPITGKIAVAYGETDDLGAKSEGITLSGRAGGVVISPMSGVIKYTGPFKHYGNLVIIDHGNDTHSLVAGSYKIDTVVGQKISAGEPIGHLQSGTRIYFEIREDGQPINPAKRIKGL